MVTIDDIEQLITTQLANQSNFALVFPGDVLFSRGPDTPNGWPYAIFDIRPSPPTLAFGDCYVQGFLVTISAYNPPESAVPPETTQTVQQFLAATFATEAACAEIQALPLRNPTERVMASRPLPGTGQFSPQLRSGSDIFISGVVISIMVQADRSLS